MKNFEKTRVRSAVKQIWELFHPVSGISRRVYPAAKALATISGSPHTILKARELLSVKSKKIGGRFMWIRPVFSVERALGREAKYSYICLNLKCPGRLMTKDGLVFPVFESERARCPSCRGRNIERFKARPFDISSLQMAMQAKGYYIKQSAALARLNYKRNRTQLYAAKKHLHIITLKDKLTGESYWVQWKPIEEFIEHLLESEDPCPMATIEKASAESGTPMHVLEEARSHLRTVKVIEKSGKKYWTDPVNNAHVRHIPSDKPEVNIFIADEGDFDIPENIDDRIARIAYLEKDLVAMKQHKKSESEIQLTLDYIQTLRDSLPLKTRLGISRTRKDRIRLLEEQIRELRSIVEGKVL